MSQVNSAPDSRAGLEAISIGEGGTRRRRKRSRLGSSQGQGKAVKGFGLKMPAIVIVTLCGFGLPQAEAIEIVGGPSPVRYMNVGVVLKAHDERDKRHSDHRPEYHHEHHERHHEHRGPGPEPVHPQSAPEPVNPHPAPSPANPPANPVQGGGVWARPAWYRWSPGGAVAAGAAIGFVTAATAAAWAGAPPQSGLC
jgi:hypothetical protein